ncbi:transcriptional coactivator p15/PC4 family protein [Candidatus Fermentibacteria bacterium]|nr:transcriptional coactivator p15/PC4 family protein [Candidatus Fermentibacteria bacterium]
MDVTVNEFQKSATERVVAKIREFHGRRYVDIRVHYLANISDNTYAPTKKGIMLSPDLLPEFADMVAKLVEACGSDGALNGEPGEP